MTIPLFIGGPAIDAAALLATTANLHLVPPPTREETADAFVEALTRATTGSDATPLQVPRDGGGATYPPLPRVVGARGSSDASGGGTADVDDGATGGGADGDPSSLQDVGRERPRVRARAPGDDAAPHELLALFTTALLALPESPPPAAPSAGSKSPRTAGPAPLGRELPYAVEARAHADDVTAPLADPAGSWSWAAPPASAPARAARGGDSMSRSLATPSAIDATTSKPDGAARVTSAIGAPRVATTEDAPTSVLARRTAVTANSSVEARRDHTPVAPASNGAPLASHASLSAAPLSPAALVPAALAPADLASAALAPADLAPAALAPADLASAALAPANLASAAPLPADLASAAPLPASPTAERARAPREPSTSFGGPAGTEVLDRSAAATRDASAPAADSELRHDVPSQGEAARSQEKNGRDVPLADAVPTEAPRDHRPMHDGASVREPALPITAGEERPSPARAEARDRSEVAAETANRLAVRHGVVAAVDVPDLGNIRVDAHRRGEALDVSIVAERPEAASLIDGARGELSRELRQDGVRVGTLEVSSGPGDRSGGSSASPQRDDRQRAPRETWASAPAIPPTPVSDPGAARRVRIVL